MRRGKIIKSLGGFYTIDSQGQEVTARAKGNFRHYGLTPMVGDLVNYSFDDRSGVDNLAYIEEVYDRKNQLLRPPVANVDQVLVLVPIAQPHYNLYLLDLLLVHYALEDLPVGILFTKSDLDEKTGKALEETYQKVGYDTSRVNLKAPGVQEAFLPYLRGKTTALAGVSAAGKSTFTSLFIEQNLETNTVSDKTKRGRHTTRHVELYPGEDFYILDTPGFSRINVDKLMLDGPEDLENYFLDFRTCPGQCKFLDCHHQKEPSCKIKQGVKDGYIAQSRYENYLRMYEELEEKEKRKWRS